MDAIVLAGGIPQPDEPLFQYTRGLPKALLEIAGKPMVQWVLDALSHSSAIRNVVIVGLPVDTLLQSKKKLFLIPNQTGLVENIRAAAQKVSQISPQNHFVLLVSADIPAITTEMVDWIISSPREQNLDVYYNIVTREAMEKRFPNSHRTYLQFKDLVFCSADSHLVSLHLLLEEDTGLWRKITAARKSPLRQAFLIGLDTVFLFFFRLLTLRQAENRIMRKLKVSGKVVLCPYPEIGMDVDKPHHLEIITCALQDRPVSELESIS